MRLLAALSLILSNRADSARRSAASGAKITVRPYIAQAAPATRRLFMQVTAENVVFFIVGKHINLVNN